MAITAPLFEFILKEHSFSRIFGEVLTLGRQSILFDESTLRGMLSSIGMNCPDIVFEIDKITVQANHDPTKKYITDKSLFSIFPDVNLNVMDVNGYEDANIIQDLCLPLSSGLVSKFDFIFNGSVLDNIFDPAMAIKNISRLLKPSGRVLHIEMASRLAFEYLIHGPDWFLDYYVVNNFTSCMVYIVLFDDLKDLYHGPWHIYCYFPKATGAAYNLKDIVKKNALIICLAEKGIDSTVDISPIQAHYRDDSRSINFVNSYNRMRAISLRPIFGFGDKPTVHVSSESGFADCGQTMQYFIS